MLYSRLARYVVPIFMLAVSGCSGVTLHGIQSVSLAPDDASFAVAYQQGGESLLAVVELGDNTPSVVLRPEGKNRYERPVFSADGSHLYFIHRTDDDRSDLFTVNRDGSGLQQLTFGEEGSQDIRDIALSASGDRIYLINSGFYGNYSPIAAKQPHDLDIYSVNTDGTDLRRLSFGSHYALAGLSPTADDTVIFSRSIVVDLTRPGVVYNFDIQSPPRLIFSSPYPLSKIVDDQLVLASSKTEKRVPGVESDEQLNLSKFSTVYGSGLFMIDILRGEVVNEIVYLRAQADSPAVTSDRSRVLFIRNDSVWGGEGGKTLWSVNTDGSELEEIKLLLAE